MEQQELRTFMFSESDTDKSYLLIPESIQEQALKRFKSDFHLVVSDELFGRTLKVIDFLRKSRISDNALVFVISTLKEWTAIQTSESLSARCERILIFQLEHIENYPQFKKYQFQPNFN